MPDDDLTPLPAAPVDEARIARAVRDILIAIGEDPDRSGLRDTPKRVARMYSDILGGLHREPAEVLTTMFDAEYDDLVLVRDIPVYSMCEHHMVPWFGVAHVGYLPANGRITGLSKLARLVDIYASRLQVQEQLTIQVARAVEEHLSPRGVIVVVEAEHLCMSMRGVRKPGARTVTSDVRGQFRESPSTRAEAMSLILGHHR